MNKPTFKDIIFLNIQTLTNFPYIEKDFDALTDYGLLCKVVDKMNEVIENNNIQNEYINNLYNAFVSLKEYIDNYFENLDVQDEINNKLEDMAESGQLTDIIAQYLGLAGMIAFNNVDELKAAENLVNGSKCETLGFYNVNDGGNAKYKIRTVTNDDVIDNFSLIALTNLPTLVAELIVDETTNVKKFGAVGDGSHDDTDNFVAYINFCNTKLKNIKVPNGKYKITDDLPALNRSLSIIGEKGNNTPMVDPNYKTVILDYRNSENFLITYDSGSAGNLGNSIYDISFSNASENELKCINFNHGGYKSIIENVSFNNYLQGLVINGTHATKLQNVNFFNCGGRENNSNTYALDISHATDVKMENCMAEYCRFAVKTHDSANSFEMLNCYFEIVTAIGYTGDSPLVITGGRLSDNTFVTRPVATIATAINDTIDNVYYYITAYGVTMINNRFSVGGANDGTTDTNKLQGKYLSIDSTKQSIITNNNFINTSFETPSIKIRSRGTDFSNNLVSINIQEATSSTFMTYYCIDERYITAAGSENHYQIISNNTSSGQLSYIPRLAYYDTFEYKLDSLYNNGTSYDIYIYGYKETSIGNYPTLYIENLTTGMFDVELIDMNGNGVNYRSVITFNIANNYTAVQTPFIGSLSGKKIKLIKDTDRLALQVTGSSISVIKFRVTNISRAAFVYMKSENTEITQNVLRTIE